MSKPRSRLIDYKNTVYRTVHGYTTEIHFGKQAKHMPGQPNFDPTKSTITVSITTIQSLVEHYAGTGQSVSHSNKELVNFGTVIGIFRKPGQRKGSPTTRGTIHYSKTGAHVVPADPRPNGGI